MGFFDRLTGTGSNKDLLNQGIQHLHNNKYAQAMSCFDTVLASDAHNSVAWFKKGETIYLSSKEPEAKADAITYFESALKIDPNYSDAWFLKGLCHLYNDQDLEALNAFDTSLKIKPNDLAVWTHKAISLQKLGRIKEAIDCVDNAIKINSKDNDLIEFRVTLTTQLDNHKKSSVAQTETHRYCENCGKEIRSEIKFCNNCGTPGSLNNQVTTSKIEEILYNEGFEHLCKEEYDEGLSCFDKLIKLNPNFTKAWHYKGLTALQINKFEVAYECFDKCTELYIRDSECEPSTLSDVWFLAGMALTKLNRINEANKCFDEAIGWDPDNEELIFKIDQLRVM